jgi:glycosyltransferase involved in cell wall biosynthesis
MSDAKIIKTLYLCYFGVREPLVQTQVIAYLRQLAGGGIRVSLLTFEPEPAKNWTAEQIAETRAKLAADGIEWYFLAYHKRPSVPATLYDIACGALFARKLARREQIDILHGRSHVATFMGAIARYFSSRRLKLIFDIRGLLAEEYVDAGHWEKDGRLFRALKNVEGRLLRSADGFVVLTEKARELLFPGSRETGFDRAGRSVEVIPCCVDHTRFEAANIENRAAVTEEFGLNGRLVIAYIGSFGGWYMTEETAAFFVAAKEKDPSAFAMILTQSDPELIKPELLKGGYTENDIFIRKVSPAEIPRYLSAADLALSFIKPCFSKLSSSPTKVAEYLASGVPVIHTRGIGDVDELIATDRVGVLVDDFTTEGCIKALEEIEALRSDDGLAERCKQSARARFDLGEVGGVRYRRLYANVSARRP